jgi:3',5'-cyclic AMP phosphodiesterase CpdA
VDRCRALVVSDTHLSPRNPAGAASWAAVLAHAERTRPDLVIHLGDLSLDGANDPDELLAARAALDRLAAPWLAIPGNHDVGDNPAPGTPPAWTISESRLHAWLDAIGPDRVAADVGGVRVVGINPMLAGSGLPAEQAQWDWLAAELTAAAAQGKPVVLASHKPLDAPAEERAAASPARFVPAAARERIDALLGGVRAPLVLSGHVHQHRVLELDGRTHAWAPTTWAVLADDVQPAVGTKRCGVLELAVDDVELTTRLVEPDGLAQRTLGVDLPDPYAP